MGRVSKRRKSKLMASGESGGVACCNEKRYKAGVYARISADIEGKTESIDVQIGIAEKFVEDFNQKNKEKIDIVGYYRDIGKTGSNFERDGFNRLMQDIRFGDVDCVIVKDLSRFARNYLEAGNYIEKIFPFLGVRFIAISDCYDTGKKSNDTSQMAVEIKNLVNDMYTKDFSVKAKTGLKQRRESGSYVGGPPPYGYKTSWEGKVRKLVPDESTAGIVESIYKLFVEKGSYKAVADDLNRRRVNPPAVYAKTKEVYCQPDMVYKGWDETTIKKIVSRKTYIGSLVQGKTTITARDEKKRIHKPEGEWVIKENTHEALISNELFQKAQIVREKLQAVTASHAHPSAEIPIGENVFEYVLYCGVCGKKMTRVSYVQSYKDGTKARQDGYLCLNSTGTKVEVCQQPNRISKRELTAILMPVIQMEFGIYLSRPKRYIEVGEKQIQAASIQIEKEIKSIRRKMQETEEEKVRVYMEYRDGKHTQEEYINYKAEQDECIKEMEKESGELERKRENSGKIREKYLRAVRSLLRLKKSKDLTMELVDALIEKIYVYPEKRIEVQFGYTDRMLEGVGK